jgi:hypothetical protein
LPVPTPSLAADPFRAAGASEPEEHVRAADLSVMWRFLRTGVALAQFLDLHSRQPLLNDVAVRMRIWRFDRMHHCFLFG